MKIIWGYKLQNNETGWFLAENSRWFYFWTPSETVCLKIKKYRLNWTVGPLACTESFTMTHLLGVRLFRRFYKWSLRWLDRLNPGFSYLRYTRCFCKVWGSIWAFGFLRTRPASGQPRKICKKISVLQRHVASRGWKMLFIYFWLNKKYFTQN